MSDSGKQIIRGHINIIILKALLEGDKYGYEIGKYIEEKSEGDYKIKQPTLYSSLKRLEDRKIIESYWGDDSITHGGRRKYFKLTDFGKEICSDNVDKWNQSKNVIDKLISVKKINNIPEKKQPLHTIFNKPEFSDEMSPQLAKQPRSQQLFYIDNRQNEKDIEYRKILSKLLSNVKNDDNDVKEKPLFEKQTYLQPENQSDKQKSMFFQDSHKEEIIPPQEHRDININLIQRDYNKQQKQIEFDDFAEKEENMQQQSYSLLPSSSQKTAFSKLQQNLNEQGFILKPYTDLRKQSKQFLLINKINMVTAIILYLLIALHTSLIYLLCEPIIKIGTQYYIYAVSIMLVLPLSSLLGYMARPGKKTKKLFYIRNLIIGSLLLFMLAVLCIISIALLFDINLNSIKDITVKLIIPISYALHFVIYWIIWGILYKSKKYFEN